LPTETAEAPTPALDVPQEDATPSADVTGDVLVVPAQPLEQSAESPVAPGFLPPPTLTSPGALPPRGFPSLLPGPQPPLAAPAVPPAAAAPDTTGAVSQVPSVAQLIDNSIIVISYAWLCCGVLTLMGATLVLVWLIRRSQRRSQSPGMS
jgi:hypothetical protein